MMPLIAAADPDLALALTVGLVVGYILNWAMGVLYPSRRKRKAQPRADRSSAARIMEMASIFAIGAMVAQATKAGTRHRREKAVLRGRLDRIKDALGFAECSDKEVPSRIREALREFDLPVDAGLSTALGRLDARWALPTIALLECARDADESALQLRRSALEVNALVARARKRAGS